MEKVSKLQLIDIRKLFNEIIKDTQVGQESAKAPAFLTEMKSLAHKAGGAAPLPQRLPGHVSLRAPCAVVGHGACTLRVGMALASHREVRRGT